MGIALNALVIIVGGLLGSRLHKGVGKDSFRSLGICIIIVSLVGFFENIYSVQGGKITSENLILVLCAYMIGTKLGQWMHMEEWFSNVGKGSDIGRNAVLDGFMFFGIGGLQICGPVALAMQGDNSQLLLKSAIDAPFALVFGAAYGKITALSAFPVALMQLGIAAIAFAFGGLISDASITLLCCMGYIVLFFTGFNLISDRNHKVDNINMLPGILLVLLFNGLKELIL